MKKSILRTVNLAVIAALVCTGMHGCTYKGDPDNNCGGVAGFFSGGCGNNAGGGGPGYDPCVANPSGPGCGPVVGVCDNGPTSACCAAQPSYSGCYVDPCDANPTPDCPGYCTANPTVPQCQQIETCETNPSMYGCPGFCQANSDHPECNTDPCVANPFGQGCPGYCEINPDAQGCPGVVDYYCRWPTGCYPIDNPNAPNPDYPWMTELDNCRQNGFVSEFPDCRDYPVTQDYYCRWETDCFKIDNPNAPNPDNPWMTELDNCRQNGFVSEFPDCHDYVPPNPSDSTFTDTRDGRTYRKVKIGTQTWMAENLNYEAAGSKCGNETSGLLTEDTADCAKYGRLYNWSTAMNKQPSSSANPSEVQGVCPVDWHLPSDEEWTKLTDDVGGASTAGTKLKAASGWNSGGNGTGQYDFSALPGGYGYSDDNFNVAGSYGYWWSATERNANYAWSRSMYYDGGNVYRNDENETNLFSVRCVQDDP